MVGMGLLRACSFLSVVYIWNIFPNREMTLCVVNRIFDLLYKKSANSFEQFFRETVRGLIGCLIID